MKTTVKKIFVVFFAVLIVVSTVLVGDISVCAAGFLIWPVPDAQINYWTTYTGHGYDGKSWAADIPANKGLPIVAAMNGTVVSKYTCSHNLYNSSTQSFGACSLCEGFGTGLVILGDDGRYYHYAHMTSGSIPSSINADTYVYAGQQIGQVGNTGAAAGAHLHFEITAYRWRGDYNLYDEVFHTHSYGDWTTVSYATCTQSGTEKRVCAGCGNSETRTVLPLGHDMRETVVPPTAGARGYTIHACARNCGYSYIDSYVSPTGGALFIDPMGGVYDNGHQHTERTEYSGAAGCSTDFGTVTRQGYHFAGWAVIDDPSNGEQGCLAPYGKPLNNDPQFAGSMGDVRIYNNLENGSVSIESVPAAPDSKMTSANMLKITTTGSAAPGLGGYYTPVYSKYGGLFYCMIVAKIPEGYTLVNYNNTLPDGTVWEWLTPTKGTGEFAVYVLKVKCGSSGNTGSFGHFAIDGPAATASNPVSWYLSYSCIFDATDVPQDEGYNFTFGKTITYAFALWEAHDYAPSVTKAATCTETGLMTYTCSCGETYTEILSALGHDYQSGVCTRCREADPEYVPPVIGTQKGDVDGDSSVTVSDLTVVAKYLAGWQVTLDLESANVDGQPGVTVSDLTVLAKYLAGWQVTLV